MDVQHFVGQLDDECLRKESETCKHSLVHREVVYGRHRLFNFHMDFVDAHTSSHKLDTVFEELKCAANFNPAFGFVLKSVEDGICPFYYAHEKNILMERSRLVVTEEVFVKTRNVLSNTDVIKACTKKRS